MPTDSSARTYRVRIKDGRLLCGWLDPRGRPICRGELPALVRPPVADPWGGSVGLDLNGWGEDEAGVWVKARGHHRRRSSAIEPPIMPLPLPAKLSCTYGHVNRVEAELTPGTLSTV